MAGYSTQGRSALLASLAHAGEDAAAQRDGRLGGAITFREDTLAPCKKGHVSGEHLITLEAIEEHGIKTRTIDNQHSTREITHNRAKSVKARRETHTLAERR